jgi:CRISPR-associated protein Cmx8
LPESISLVYDPLSLPTSQHRAGLAGLLVLVETLRNRGVVPIPEIEYLPDARIQLRFDEEALTAVFDDLYAATEEEQPRSQKLTRGKLEQKQTIAPVREEVVEESGKKRTIYYYKQVIPRAPFLAALQVPPVWLKLWRDAVWTCVRGVPNTRIPYQERSAGAHVTEASKAWKNLMRFAADLQRGRLHTVALSGSLYIGSQAASAERVPFAARADEALLLHFWPVVMGVSVPRALDRDGKPNTTGYLLTLPDVSDFRNFPADYREMAAGLPAEVQGIYPKDAYVTLPEEGGLEYLANLATLSRTRALEAAWSFSVAGIDVFHMDKRGNNIPLLYTGRVPADLRLLTGYELVRREYRNVLFRRQLLVNLLRGRPWYRGFQHVFANQPHSSFLGAEGRYFHLDVIRRIQNEREATK